MVVNFGNFCIILVVPYWVRGHTILTREDVTYEADPGEPGMKDVTDETNLGEPGKKDVTDEAN